MVIPEHLKRKDSESINDYLIRLYENKENYEIDNYTIANLMNKEAGTNYGESKWRKDFAAYRYWKEYLNSKKGALKPDDINYQEKVEILGNGTHKSDKLLRMSEEDSKNPEFLLRAHGYDPEEWELVSARNNIWNVYSQKDGINTLYSSKITVKPLVNKFDPKRLVEKLEKFEPVKLKINKNNFEKSEGLLEIPLFDQHFGVTDYDYYKPTQEKIAQKILSKKRDEILFVVGQDLMHNDGFTSQTTNGTVIEKVDMEQAWEDASNFYRPLIELSLENSNNVKIIYSAGNHDEAMSWCFVKYLKALYPMCDYDDSLEEHKLHIYGDNAIGFTHGDKGGQKARNEVHNIFSALYPTEWGQAKNREIHMGHFHIEDAKDKFGTMVRTLATKNKTDEWHKRNGFVGGHKRFMLFEYSRKQLESIYYI